MKQNAIKLVSNRVLELEEHYLYQMKKSKIDLMKIDCIVEMLKFNRELLKTLNKQKFQ